MLSNVSGEHSATSTAKSSAGSAILACSHPVTARTDAVSGFSSSANVTRNRPPLRSACTGVGANRQADTSSSARSHRDSSAVGTCPVAAPRSRSPRWRVRHVSAS